jgi:hypothetical protein
MAKLLADFSDILIDGKYSTSPFMAGDEIEIHHIIPGCPDLGCCECEVIFSHPDFEDGRQVVGYIYHHLIEMGSVYEGAEDIPF